MVKTRNVQGRHGFLGFARNLVTRESNGYCALVPAIVQWPRCLRIATSLVLLEELVGSFGCIKVVEVFNLEVRHTYNILDQNVKVIYGLGLCAVVVPHHELEDGRVPEVLSRIWIDVDTRGCRVESNIEGSKWGYIALGRGWMYEVQAVRDVLKTEVVIGHIGRGTALVNSVYTITVNGQRVCGGQRGCLRVGTTTQRS